MLEGALGSPQDGNVEYSEDAKSRARCQIRGNLRPFFGERVLALVGFRKYE